MSRAYNQALNNQAPNIPSLVRALQRSIAYHKSIQGSKQYDVIDSYRKEIDPSEWDDAPLLLSYQLINWAMKRIHKNSNVAKWRGDLHVPKLLKSNTIPASIQSDTLKAQVDHAKILDDTLHTFPRLEGNKSIIVYHAESTYYNEKASQMKIGDELVILPFLSTSINRYVANRFIDPESKIIWEIIVSPGQIFPYVSESMPLYLGVNNGLQNEQEVLFPTHARLQLVHKIVDQVPNIYRFQLVGFAEKSPDFWDTTHKKLENALTVARSRPRRFPKKYGGTSKAIKTQKQTKNNRKSRRKARK
jgi:hypothetical protein